jgi:hypothetical protein
MVIDDEDSRRTESGGIKFTAKELEGVDLIGLKVSRNEDEVGTIVSHSIRNGYLSVTASILDEETIFFIRKGVAEGNPMSLNVVVRGKTEGEKMVEKKIVSFVLEVMNMSPG